MHEESRTYRTCMFCDAPGPLTRAPLFGEVLAARYPRLGFWTAEGCTPGAHELDLAPRAVCAGCAEHQLARTMRPGLELMHRLTACCEPFTLDAGQVRALHDFWVRIGFLVDVATSNHQLSDAYRNTPAFARVRRYRSHDPTYTRRERAAWLFDDVAPPMIVALGFHAGELGRNPFAQVVHLREVGEVDGKPKVVARNQFLVVIGKLAAVVDLGATDRWRPAGYRRVDDRPARIDWPPVPGVSHGDFFALYPAESPYPELVDWFADPANGMEADRLIRASDGPLPLPHSFYLDSGLAQPSSPSGAGMPYEGPTAPGGGGDPRPGAG